jgi:hypothetical protein
MLSHRSISLFFQRREVEEFLEARARGVKNRGGKSSGAGTALRAVGRFLNSNTGQTVAATLASGVAQRIANGGAGAVPQPGYVVRKNQSLRVTRCLTFTALLAPRA